MRNNLLLLHFFSIFLNPQRVTLTYSAMTDGPIDVQLRWANLRAREHHVKGPKKSPRKMVLRRLILRKAEEAKRTTTWAPYRVQCPCLQCQNQPRWILLNFPSVDMGTLSKTVGFSLYPCHWVPPHIANLPLMRDHGFVWGEVIGRDSGVIYFEPGLSGVGESSASGYGGPAPSPRRFLIIFEILLR